MAIKNILIIFVCLSWLTSCRTKQLDIEKTKIRQENEFLRKMDSLFRENSKIIQKMAQAQRSESLKLSLESVTDSKGSVTDFEYTHEKDGKVVESVKVKGAKVKGEMSNSEQSETRIQVSESDKTTRIQNNTHQKTVSETTSKSKSKKVRSFGFSFGIYVMIAGALLFGFGIYKMRKQWKLM